MFTIYVAGASREHERVKKWAAKLDERGFQVVDRWFDTADKWAGTDAEYTRQEQAGFAETHERAIRGGRMFWLLWPEQVSHGAFYELGYANCHRWHLGPNRPLHIVVTGKGASTSIYTASADYREEGDALGFHDLCNHAQKIAARWGAQ